MESLPVEVYSAASVRAMDRRAIEGGIAGYDLMRRAGQAAFAALRSHWPSARSVTIACGPGNNGGDGYVVAHLARAAGFAVRVIAVHEPARLRGDAARACADFRSSGGEVEPYTQASFDDCDVVVDALLGSGLDRDVADALADTILRMNGCARPVFSLDIPSGLDADSGWPRGLAVHAARTIAFLALKQGYFLGAAADHVGALGFAGLAVPDAVRTAAEPAMRRIDGGLLAGVLRPRKRSAHKGEHGRILVIGGQAMPGAARLVGEAALRTGAGLVTVLTSASQVLPIVAGCPELIARGGGPDSDGAAAAGFDAVAIGPGSGVEGDAGRWLDLASASCHRLVVDADALTLLAAKPRRRDGWILTPHPGEAARLLGTTTAAVQQDRLAAVRDLAARYGGACVLKGANTLVCAAGATPWVCDRGNPGMATAGSGDVLTGVIAALFAQSEDPARAAAAGVLVHAEAGDCAARRGMRGMMASDILAELRGVVNRPWS
jgi:NAD(P)H-hydrate epimerase